MAVITRQRFISRGAEAQRKHRERVKRKIKETEEQLSISRASEAKKTQEIASLRARLLRCSNAVQKMSPGTCTTDTTKHATVFDNINVTASPRQVMPDTCVDDPVYEVDKDQPIPTVETPGKDIAEDNDPFHAFFNAVPLDPQPKAWTTTGTGCVEDALKSGTIADYRRDADCRRDVSCDGLPPNTSAPASVLDWTASMDGMTETSLPSDYFDLDLSNSSADCRVETELYRSDQAGRVMDDSGFDVSSTTAGLGAMDQSGASAGGAAKTSEFHLGPSGHQGVMNPIWHTKSTPADARRTYANINDNTAGSAPGNYDTPRQQRKVIPDAAILAANTSWADELYQFDATPPIEYYISSRSHTMMV
ncbi:Hypothetical protein D9617_70g089310 [Elsinoe fawcettii]|nr:Hypothetical protein D9617_70g089310 [Elsinoe fawcettii]